MLPGFLEGEQLVYDPYGRIVLTALLAVKPSGPVRGESEMNQRVR